MNYWIFTHFSTIFMYPYFAKALFDLQAGAVARRQLM